MDKADGGLHKEVRFRSAVALVVANMVGAGIFTTTGFQAADLGHPGYIFLLWIVGGILAFCGALCFAELGAAMPHAGAEYVYLRESYGMSFAFTNAFVAVLAGFSAPIAAALKTLVRYLGHFVPVLADDPVFLGFIHLDDVAAVCIGWAIVGVHISGIRAGLRFNDFVTAFKVLGILAIIGAAAFFGSGNTAHFTHVAPVYRELSLGGLFSAMATSLIFVTFCYMGWNGSAYMAAEMKNPQRDLPLSLLAGTAFVTVLYLALNLVYFYGADVSELAGKVEVGLVASRNLFGGVGVSLVTAVLCVSILASASAMTVAGPRVYYAFGKDFAPLRFLGTVSAKKGAPVKALVLQGIVITVIVFSGTIDQILQYAGFTLSLFSSLAVSCVIVLRIKRPDMKRPFKAWGYPFTPLLYIAVSLWTMAWAFRGRPIESTLSLVTVLVGGAIFYAISRAKRST